MKRLCHVSVRDTVWGNYDISFHMQFCLVLEEKWKAMGLNVVAEFISTSALCIWSPGWISSLESAILTYVFWFSTVSAGICWEDVLQQITSISFLVYDKHLRVYNLSTKASTFNQDTIKSCTSRHKNNSWKQITNLTITCTVYSNETQCTGSFRVVCGIPLFFNGHFNSYIFSTVMYFEQQEDNKIPVRLSVSAYDPQTYFEVTDLLYLYVFSNTQ